MGLITSILTSQPIGATYSDDADFWYRHDPRGAETESGYPVGPETAMRLGAVYACVGLIADMLGSLPLILYRRLDNEGKERATSNPLYNLLRRQPNARQTSKEWRTMGGAHLLLRGNFYNEILFDRRGSVSELRPLHPDRVRVRLLDSGQRGYVYTPPAGPQRPLTQDEMFHVMGLSLDGVVGCSVIEYARESIGSAQAQEGFAGRFWRQGSEGHLAFVAPNALSPQSREANEKALRERMGGWQKSHQVILLEGGAKPERLTAMQKDTQYLDSRKFSAVDICQFFRVPPDLIGHNDGTSQWGTGIEQRMIGFINFTMMPWFVAFEQAVDRDLILDERHFAEFLVDALLRGETTARATAHRQYVDGGIKSVNEVRVTENLNPLPGPEFERPHRAGNIGGNPGGGNPETTQRPPAPRQPTPIEDDEDTDDAAARAAHATVTAANLVGKETAALRTWAPRYAGNAAGWRKFVAEFYGKHVDTIVRRLGLDATAARRYGADHCAEILARGTVVLDEWDQQAPAQLAALALQGEPA